DYAAASDYISKLAISLSNAGVRAFAVDMSAFAQVGMAIRPGVEAFLKSQGLDFLDPEEGMQAICDEIVYGCAPEIVLSSNLGALDWDKQLKTESAPSLSGGNKPLLGKIITLEKNNILRAEKEFSLEKDPYLADHSIAGTAYVPGVMGIETFMESASALYGRQVLELRDLRFSLPIKLLKNRPQLVKINGQQSGKEAVFEIESEFINSQGVKMGPPRKHFSAKSLGGGDSPGLMREKHAPSGKTISQNEIYKLFFHGPSFQVLKSARVDKNFVFAVYKKPLVPLWPQNPLQETAVYPLIIESAFQACGLRDITVDKAMALPDAIKRVCVNVSGAAPEELNIWCIFKGKDRDGKSLYDAFVFDEKGQIWVELNDYRTIPQ
ncbi:MAG: polyketide synthase dehydratase domain-containing protein, partial [Elusimicrobia bacterium]|nr:polyketide synthase dehydratase domain-containing protein [Elusimicrobiota bacterium]